MAYYKNHPLLQELYSLKLKKALKEQFINFKTLEENMV